MYLSTKVKKAKLVQIAFIRVNQVFALISDNKVILLSNDNNFYTVNDYANSRNPELSSHSKQIT